MSNNELNQPFGSLPHFEVEAMGGNAVLFWPIEGASAKEQYIWGESEVRCTQMMEGICRELNKRVDMINAANGEMDRRRFSDVDPIVWFYQT